MARDVEQVLLDKVQPVKQNIKTHDRITVRQTIFHDQFGHDPTQVEGTQTFFLDGKEDPFARTITVGAEERPLDLGWLDSPGDVSFIALENKASVPPGLKPSPEQIAEAEAKVVVYGLPGQPGFKVRPGGMMFFEAEDAKGLVIRCLSGDVKVRITAFPS